MIGQIATRPFAVPLRLARSPELLWLGPVLLIVLLLVLVAVAMAAPFVDHPGTLLLIYAGRGLQALAALFWLLASTLLVQSLLRREPHPIAAARRLLANGQVAERLCTGSVLIGLMAVLLSAFGTLKILLPLYRPFAYDAPFAAIGRFALGGVAPWQITHAILGSPWATLALDRLYTAWMVAMPLAFLYFAFAVPAPIRARFYATTALVWVLLGVIGAYLCSSAGPTFLDLLDHPEASRFAPLMARLQAAEQATGMRLDALSWREMLWYAYETRSTDFGMGISAMPSLHVAMSAVYVFAAYRVGRTFGRLTLLFALLIWIGSIHLAWHYAADGIVSAVAVALIWTGVDRYLSAVGYDRALARVSRRDARAGEAGARSA